MKGPSFRISGYLKQWGTGLTIDLILDLLATMPETNKTAVNQGSNGQYKTTVPKGLAEAYDLNGKKLEWSVKAGNKLVVEVVEPSGD